MLTEYLISNSVKFIEIIHWLPNLSHSNRRPLCAHQQLSLMHFKNGIYCFICLSVCVFAAAVPQSFCLDKFCSAHEFCGEKRNDGEPDCLCRAIFASKYRSTNTFGQSVMTRESYRFLKCYFSKSWKDFSEEELFQIYRITVEHPQAAHWGLDEHIRLILSFY